MNPTGELSVLCSNEFHSTPTAYSNRGFAYRKLGRYRDAIREYSRALELNPDNVKTYNNRGYSYAKDGEYDRAIADYNKVRISFGEDATLI